MLALIDPSVLPALRIAGTFFLIINLIGGTYIFRNRHRFFDQDTDVDNDIPTVRKLRMEVVMIRWFDLKSYLHADQQLCDPYADSAGWSDKAILNVASSGKFSSDRTIAEYAADIWEAKACPVS